MMVKLTLILPGESHIISPCKSLHFRYCEMSSRCQRLRYKGQQTHRAWITCAFIKVYYSLFSSLLSQVAYFMFTLYLIRYVSYVRYILFSPDIPMGMAGKATKLQALVP